MNNKRRRESQEKIQKTFIELLQTREIKEISVSALIKTAGLNRSTFYANYIDIFDLADKTREKLESDFSNLFADYDYYNERSGALKMFRHIKENQIFYNTYFKLCYDDSHLVSKYDTERAQKEHMDSNLKYHIEFFRNDLDNTIRVQCAAEGDIFRFTALSSLKYSSISASCRLKRRKISRLCGRRFCGECPSMAARRTVENIPGYFEDCAPKRTRRAFPQKHIPDCIV